MQDWTKEEIQFVTEYFNNYPIKEIATEINRSTKEVNDLAKKLGIVTIILPEFKKCKDCNKVKPLKDFYRRSSSKLNSDNNRRNSYCKTCDGIRRRNNAILKKLKIKMSKVLEKEKLAEILKKDTENIYFECISCGGKKIGKDFYFDSYKLKRFNICILCYLKKQKDKELKKVLERGY